MNNQIAQDLQQKLSQCEAELRDIRLQIANLDQSSDSEVLTMEEVYDKVQPSWYLCGDGGDIAYLLYIDGDYINNEANFPSENHGKQICATINMMNVAELLNEGWSQDIIVQETEAWAIEGLVDGEWRATKNQHSIATAPVIFKTKELAEQAIKIMGDERLNHYTGHFE